MTINILGCDGSHGLEYARIYSGLGHDVLVWDAQTALAEHVVQHLTGCHLLRDVSMMEGDLSLVTGRYVTSHFLPAKYSLTRRIPTYIDKPGIEFSSDLEYLLSLAERDGIPLCGFSPLLKSSEYLELLAQHTNQVKRVVTPAFCSGIDDERARCISFYGSHGVDLVTHDKSVPITRVSTSLASSCFTTTITFEDGDVRVLELLRDTEEIYILHFESNGYTQNTTIDPYGDFYMNTANYLILWSQLEPRSSDLVKLRNSNVLMSHIKKELMGVADTND